MENQNQQGHRPEAKSVEGSTRELFQLFLQRKWIFLSLGLAAFSLIIAQHFLYPTYKVSTSLLLQKSGNSPLQAIFAKVGGSALMNESAGTHLENDLAPYVAFLSSTDFCNQLTEKLLKEGRIEGLKPGFPSIEKDSSFDHLSRVFKGAISISDNRSSMIFISTTSADRQVTVDFANLVAELALQKIREDDSRQIEAARLYVEDKLNSIMNQSQLTGNELISFRRHSDLLTVGVGEREFAGKVMELERELAESKIVLEQNKKMIALFTEELNGGSAAAGSTQDASGKLGPVRRAHMISNLQKQLEVLRYKYNQLSVQGMETEAPSMKQLEQSISDVRQRLAAISQKNPDELDSGLEAYLNQPGSITQTMATLRAENRNLTVRIEAINQIIRGKESVKKSSLSQDQQLESLKRKLSLEFSLFEELKRKLFEVEVQQVSLASRFRVLERPLLPDVRRSLPITMKIFVGALVAFLLSVAITIALESFDPIVKTKNDLVNLGFSIVGTIPKFHTAKSRVALLTLNQDSGDAMPFKHIRAMVVKRKQTLGLSSAAVTVLSSRPGEGKSLLATNLAISLSQMGYKTLLLDCDIRRPKTTSEFSMAGKPGLTSILEQNVSLKDCTIKNIQGIADLDFVPAGPYSPKGTELIGGKAFETLLAQLREQYEFILMDSPPVVAAADSLSIANLADIPLFLVRVLFTKKAELEDAVSKMISTRHKQLYAVMNSVDQTRGSEYYYYQQYFPSSPGSTGGGSSFKVFSSAGSASSKDTGAKKSAEKLPESWPRA